MASKKPTLLIRIDERTKEAMRKAAIAEERSMAWLYERAGREWLERNGYLPPPKKKPTR